MEEEIYNLQEQLNNFGKMNLRRPELTRARIAERKAIEKKLAKAERKAVAMDVLRDLRNAAGLLALLAVLYAWLWFSCAAWGVWG